MCCRVPVGRWRAPADPAAVRSAARFVQALSQVASPGPRAGLLALLERTRLTLDEEALVMCQGRVAARGVRRSPSGSAALPEGGLLATASCTAQVSPAAFRDALAQAAAEAAVEAQVLHESGHAPDHPVPLAFPEGRYLKFVLLRVTRPARAVPATTAGAHR